MCDRAANVLAPEFGIVIDTTGKAMRDVRDRLSKPSAPQRRIFVLCIDKYLRKVLNNEMFSIPILTIKVKESRSCQVHNLTNKKAADE